MSQINWARGGEPYDNRPVEGVATLERAFAAGTAQRVGWYRFYFSDERWEWSPEVEQIHGYQPGTVTPTTQLVLSHKHPADYAYVAATLEDIRQSHRPFSSRHRIITVQGDTRDIVVIGERLHDNSGEVIGTHGFYIDVTHSNEAREATISEAVAEIAEHRAAIEQAKGVLMYVYHIDSAAAFRPVEMALAGNKHRRAGDRPHLHRVPRKRLTAAFGGHPLPWWRAAFMPKNLWLIHP